MEYLHPYSRYGLALVMEENGLNEKEEVTHKHLYQELIRGLGHFRLRPSGVIEGAKEVKFDYMTFDFLNNNKIYQGKGKSEEGIFLSPNIITSEKGAGNAWTGTHSILTKLNNKVEKNEKLTMSIFAASAKFNNGKKGQDYPKTSLSEVACAAITNTTPLKPCLTYRIFKGGKTERINTAIIPDLPLDKMIKFISLFKSMQSDVKDDLLKGKVSLNIIGKGKKAKTIYRPWRPNIYNGNFPNSPKSSALGILALLGAIGEWSQKANLWSDGEEVLDSLKNVPIYMVSYGSAKSCNYSHHVIELAKKLKLNSVVDAVYHTKLINNKNRKQDINEYQAFDLFSSRFLQLFNQPAFKDFLSFRAEYPSQLEILFYTYFTKMENIPIEIVTSAKELGRWLNYVAYLAAKTENHSTKSEDFKKAKAKVLVEIESSVFSAKSGDSLIAQVVTRAGRLSQMDAPPEASVFIEQTCSGKLPLDNAKNLLMAFSRLRNTYEKSNQSDEEEDSVIDTSEYDNI